MQLRVSAEGVAGMAGVATCGSVWACPVCASKILAARTGEVQEAVQRWMSADPGHAVALATVTVRHGKRSRLKRLLDGMNRSWARMTQQRSWRKARQQYGWRWQIRALECRYGCEGWHPHFHVIVFLERELSDDWLKALAGEFFANWIAAAREEGLTARLKGQDFKMLHGDVETVAKDAGAYVTKEHYNADLSEDARGVAFELTRGDLKSSRSGVSVAPFELLTAMVWHLGESGGDLGSIDRLVTVWREYERATKGRRQLTWSPGMRKALGMLPEKSDDEHAAEEIGTDADALLEISGRAYRRLVASSKDGACGLLDATEAGFAAGGRAAARAAAAEYLASRSVPWRPVQFTRARPPHAA